MLRQTGCALCIARLPHNWTANWQLHIAPLKLNKIKRRQQNREIQQTFANHNTPPPPGKKGGLFKIARVPKGENFFAQGNMMGGSGSICRTINSLILQGTVIASPRPV